MIKKILFLFAAVPLLASCDWLGEAAGIHTGDFYECPPDNTLVVCKVGTGPPANCEAVGSGQTTIEPKAC